MQYPNEIDNDSRYLVKRYNKNNENKNKTKKEIKDISLLISICKEEIWRIGVENRGNAHGSGLNYLSSRQKWSTKGN